MTWKIIDCERASVPTTLDTVLGEYPNAVAYDESGWEVDLDAFTDEDASIELADLGYGRRETRKITIFRNEEESADNDGAYPVAVATWKD